jgi:hypothetical protein
LLYLAAVLLPGFGAGELLGLWEKERTFMEALGYIIGLGFSINTVILFVGSSGLQIADIPLYGVTANMFYVIILGGLFLTILSAVRKKKFTTIPLPRRTDLLVVLFMLVQGGMIYLFFQKYPIFPEYNSVDFQGHANIVQSLLSGGSSIPGGIFYFGVHFQLALGALLVGGPVLIVIQRVGAILAILGVPIVYLSASRIFLSKEAALVSSFLYAITASMWFGSLFNAGLYPNFFGILASLFFLAISSDIVRQGANWGRLITMFGSLSMLYLSHYSDVSIFPAVLIVPLVLLVKRDLKATQLAPSLGIALPGIVAVALDPGLAGLLFGAVSNPGGIVVGGTFLSAILAPIPVIANMATETYYDLGFVLLVAFSLISAWKLMKERDAVKWMPVAWLVSVTVVAPLNAGAWRLSYVALVPLTLIASYGLASLFPKPRGGTRRRGTDPRKVVVILALILLVSGSWGVTLSLDAATDTSVSSNAQQNVYNAIIWAGSNTTRGTFLSVSDYRFLYSTQLIGRASFFQLASTPSQGISYAKSAGAAYIVVTKLVTASLPSEPSLFPWNNFPAASNGNLTLVYSNSDVRIYKVA